MVFSTSSSLLSPAWVSINLLIKKDKKRKHYPRKDTVGIEPFHSPRQQRLQFNWSKRESLHKKV